MESTIQDLKTRLETESTKEDAQGTISVLQELKDKQITIELLKSTHIGVCVNKLRKHKDAQVVSLAKDLVEKWKSVVPASPKVAATKSVVKEEAKPVKEEAKSVIKDEPESTKAQPPAQQAAASPPKSAVKSEPIAAKQETTPVKQEKTSLKQETTPIKQETTSVKQEKTPVKQEEPAERETTAKKDENGVKEESKKRKAEPPARDSHYSKVPPKIPTTGDPARDKIRELLHGCLTASPREEDLNPVMLAVEIEIAMFNLYRDTGKDYKTKYRSLSFNLNNKKSSHLRDAVTDGRITPEVLVTMTANEMASPEEQAKRESIEKWHTAAATIMQPEASTDQFLCGKCKQRKCTYYQLQTRSADEPMTTFVTCTNCNNRWKFC